MPTVASETPAPSIAYRLHAAELIAALRADERQGLGDEDARARLARYGPNELAAHEAAPAWRRFLSQFQDVLVILLLVATGISAVLWVLERDAALPYEAIFAVVLLNATMAYIQESRAEAAVAALRAMSAPDATVIREGKRRSLPASEIVPGDIILIEEGDTIPADGRLIESAALQTAEAGSVGLQGMVVYVPILQIAFGTTPLSGQDWLVCVAVASSVLWLREASKAMRRSTLIRIDDTIRRI